MAKAKGVSIIAATLSGNQGAAAMLITTLSELESINPDLKIYIFSYYPEADKRLLNRSNAKVVSTKPLYLALWLLPLSLVHRIAPPLRSLIRRSSGISALENSDLMLDLAGVSFVDGREKFLLYNLATLLPAWFMRVRIVKLSQALGPFKSGLNRKVAKWFLPKLDKVFARGKETRAALDKNGLTNVESASDVAFLYHPDQQGRKDADSILKSNGLKKRQYIVVAPSSVLYKKSQKKDIDYVAAMAAYVDWLIEEHSQPVVLIPHSLREDESQLHNNDVPVCKEIFSQVKLKEKCVLLDQKHYINTIKPLIADSKLVITGRFHGMIGALSAGRSVVVTGWSHKYQEVLDSLGVQVPAVYLDNNFLDNLKSATAEASTTIAKTEKSIAEKLPAIVRNSKKQFEYVETLLR